MRFQRLIFAVILACGVTACAKNITGVTHAPPPLAYVRYINAVSDTFAMDFRPVDYIQYSQPFLNVAYRGLGDGNYQGYSAGPRHIDVFLDPSPSGVTIAVDPNVVKTVMDSAMVTLTAGQYYTVVHVGNARTGAAVKEQLWIIQDALPNQSAASVQYRVINVASVQGAVDVYVSATGTITGAATVSNLAFKGGSTTYYSQVPGPLVMKLTLPGNPLVQVGAAAGYTLQAGTAGTTAADPIYGSGQGGSILTAFIFDATPVGKVGTTFATLGVVYFPDVQPARTTSP